jgi:3-deoxy-D-manno-octulosonic-acid transferase
MSSGSAILSLYRAATSGLAFLAPALVHWRKRNGKEDPKRLDERSGVATRTRPQGPLVWLHGASVGEAIALLPLVDALRARDMQIVLTTGTVTSAQLMETRLPAGAIHQYAPLDVPRFVRRFLDHWRPNLVLFAESELWPNILMETSDRRIPIAVVNARLSERSSERWKKLPNTISSLLRRIDVTLAQSPDDAARFTNLGAPRVYNAGNLKYDVPALPCDTFELSAIKNRIGGRPAWVAASTHAGEEDIVLGVHRRLAEKWKGLVTIVVPRHPDRGGEIADLAFANGVPVRMRSRGEELDEKGGVYIADSIGELGLFYRAANIVFVGRSLVKHGGQNPIEPAKLGNAILHGPNVSNFTDVYRELNEAGGAICINDEQHLGDTLDDLFTNAAKMRAVARAASETVEKLGGASQNIMTALEPYLMQVRLEQN